MTAGTSSDGKCDISSDIAAAATACVHMFQKSTGTTPTADVYLAQNAIVFLSSSLSSPLQSHFLFLFE